ncbi:hypothetical protein GALMADRAFT_158406 [Galerina marginata CBS 339.88]|uniref:Uncharacterized protein n=1 Tax=Galerina marginata (strain CBS 339.88) TaxID=685588 RepID=A0A067STD0_GALM3|nr:hypothetical protein GALMADRAFT_158406 [Galerina marginata CBS 339.88]
MQKLGEETRRKLAVLNFDDKFSTGFRHPVRISTSRVAGAFSTPRENLKQLFHLRRKGEETAARGEDNGNRPRCCPYLPHRRVAQIAVVLRRGGASHFPSQVTGIRPAFAAPSPPSCRTPCRASPPFQLPTASRFADDADPPCRSRNPHSQPSGPNRHPLSFVLQMGPNPRPLGLLWPPDPIYVEALAAARFAPCFPTPDSLKPAPSLQLPPPTSNMVDAAPSSPPPSLAAVTCVNVSDGPHRRGHYLHLYGIFPMSLFPRSLL